MSDFPRLHVGSADCSAVKQLLVQKRSTVVVQNIWIGVGWRKTYLFLEAQRIVQIEEAKTAQQIDLITGGDA